MPQTMMRVAGDHARPMPRKINFTLTTLRALPSAPKGKQVCVYDQNTPHLQLLVTENGAKTFYWYGRLAGRPQRLKLGRFPEIGIENARKLAAKASGDIAGGGNPVKAKRAARAEMTLGEAWTWFLENHAKLKKRTWKDDEGRYSLHLAEWANRRLTEITTADAQRLHSKLTKDGHPTNANRVLALLSVLYNKARMLGHTGGNPAEGVERNRESSRERFLQADELPRFFAALDSMPTRFDPQTGEKIDDPNGAAWRDFFKLLLLTGARSGNVKSMRWADINLERGEWKISSQEFKSGYGMTVHLSAEAIAILKGRENNGSDFVFPGPGKTGHIQEPRKAWEAVLKRAKLSGLRIHDLRRSLGSWQAATGASLPVIGKSLGHRNVATTAIYARLNLDPVRESVNTATAAMMAAVNDGQKPAQKKKRH